MPHFNKQMISFYLTTRCNLDCVYCYTNKYNYERQTLDLDFAKTGIDYYFTLPYKKHLRFFGAGEPTTELQRMTEIVQYAKSKTTEKVTTEMQTNGVFNENVAKWLANNLDIIWISCDGTPDIQNKYRPFLGGGKTSHIVERNIKFLTSKEYNPMTGIRITITSDNVYRQKEMIEYFYNLGIKNIWCDPIFPSIGQKEVFNDIDTMEFAKEFAIACEYAEQKSIFYGSILTCNFDKETEYHCRACLPVPHLTTDGYVSACDMAMFGGDLGSMSVFIYGKWNKEKREIEFDDNKIKLLRERNIHNMEECKECEAKLHCGGYCLGEVTNETGNLYGCKKRVCEPIRYLNNVMTKNQRVYKYEHP